MPLSHQQDLDLGHGLAHSQGHGRDQGRARDQGHGADQALDRVPDLDQEVGQVQEAHGVDPDQDLQVCYNLFVVCL